MIRMESLRQVGQPFGAREGHRRVVRRYAVFQCDCGERVIARTDHVRTKHVRSCGCRASKNRTAWVNNGRLSQSGEAFFVAESGSRHRCAVFECECGERIIAATSQVRSGTVQSCGCAVKIRSHGQCRDGNPTGSYTSWQAMKQRCFNDNHQKYADYGGRGISVCERWRDSFEAFYADMGDRPEGMSLDRVDPDGNYEPSNCRWATQKQQMNNRRATVRPVWFQGESYTVSEFARRIGVKRSLVQYRLSIGRDAEIIVDELIGTDASASA